MNELKSPPPDEGMTDRVDAAILRYMLGEPAKPGDDMILAMTVFAGGCSSCGGRNAS